MIRSSPSGERSSAFSQRSGLLLGLADEQDAGVFWSELVNNDAAGTDLAALEALLLDVDTERLRLRELHGPRLLVVLEQGE